MAFRAHSDQANSNVSQRVGRDVSGVACLRCVRVVARPPSAHAVKGVVDGKQVIYQRLPIAGADRLSRYREKRHGQNRS
jgi:hypothetical protein